MNFQDATGIVLLFQAETTVLENFAHLSIVRQNVRYEFANTVLACDRNQVLQQKSGDTQSVKFVLDNKRHFRS